MSSQEGHDEQVAERPGAEHRLGARPGRPQIRLVVSMALVAALAMMVSSCTTVSRESPSQVWRSDGYGWIYSLGTVNFVVCVAGMIEELLLG
jgi:hypothetical protein